MVAAHIEEYRKVLLVPYPAARICYYKGEPHESVLASPFLFHDERTQNMDEDERREDVDEMNEDNDAREEDIVEDTDADTRDVEENEDENESEILRRMDALEEMLGRVIGGIDALREAQSVMVENGATIIDTEEDENFDLGVDDFVEPSELDLVL